MTFGFLVVAYYPEIVLADENVTFISSNRLGVKDERGEGANLADMTPHLRGRGRGCGFIMPPTAGKPTRSELQGTTVRDMTHNSRAYSPHFPTRRLRKVRTDIHRLIPSLPLHNLECPVAGFPLDYSYKEARTIAGFLEVDPYTGIAKRMDRSGLRILFSVVRKRRNLSDCSFAEIFFGVHRRDVCIKNCMTFCITPYNRADTL